MPTPQLAPLPFSTPSPSQPFPPFPTGLGKASWTTPSYKSPISLYCQYQPLPPLHPSHPHPTRWEKASLTTTSGAGQRMSQSSGQRPSAPPQSLELTWLHQWPAPWPPPPSPSKSGTLIMRSSAPRRQRRCTSEQQDVGVVRSRPTRAGFCMVWGSKFWGS